MTISDIAPARGWAEELSRLDRHATSALLTQDTAGLQDLMEMYRVPAVSIAVSSLDGSAWCAAHGTTGAGRPDRVDPRTVFQACSISKHVTAFGTLRLVGEGVLDLDADIASYLTSWQLPAAGHGRRPRVTVRQLLAHTAGLSYNWFRGYEAGEAAPSLLQVLRGEPPANTPPVRASMLPGSGFRYSGSHYAVLQQVLADRTATPFEDLMRTEVLEPAGMTDSSFDQQFPARGPGPARGHHITGTPVPGGWRRLPEMAAAGLWTTPADLTRLELEITRAAAGQSRLLGQELATQMLTPQVPAGMGLGTEIASTAGQLRFGHTGGNVGYRCFSFAWPGTGTAVAVMANSEGATEILGSVLSAAQRLHAAPQDPGTAAAPPDVTGRYLLREDYPVDIRNHGAALTLTAAGQDTSDLLPLPGGRYRLPGLDCEITFERTDGLAVMHIRQENAIHTATRTGPMEMALNRE